MQNSYLPKLHNIREKIQLKNSNLNTYKEKKEPSVLTQGINRKDMNLLNKCQAKTSSLSFVASADAFQFCWDAMTREQHAKHLLDYVETEYSEHPKNIQEKIYTFLQKHILTRKGMHMVQWNGYFIEHLPPLDIQVETITNKCKNNAEDKMVQEQKDNLSQIKIQFTPKESLQKEEEKKQKMSKHETFQVLRAKLQRDKKSFFV